MGFHAKDEFGEIIGTPIFVKVCIVYVFYSNFLVVPDIFVKIAII